jgi:hypothetical protein
MMFIFWGDHIKINDVTNTKCNIYINIIYIVTARLDLFLFESHVAASNMLYGRQPRTEARKPEYRGFLFFFVTYDNKNLDSDIRIVDNIIKKQNKNSREIKIF